MSLYISMPRVLFPRFGSILAKTPLESVQEYYQQVDANQFDALLQRFDASAVYEREGWPTLMGKQAISYFFKVARKLRGKHTIESIQANQYPDKFVKHRSGETVYAKGTFEGNQQGKPIHLSFQDFWVFRPQDHKVIFRKSWIQFPKGPTVKV